MSIINELNIHIKELLEENKQLKEDIRKSSENNLDIIDDNVGLKEENKQLKEDIMTLKVILAAYIIELDKQKANFIKELEELKEKHIHPNHPKLDYYDKWESSGCRFCYINRKINNLINKLKGEE